MVYVRVVIGWCRYVDRFSKFDWLLELCTNDEHVRVR